MFQSRLLKGSYFYTFLSKASLGYICSDICVFLTSFHCVSRLLSCWLVHHLSCIAC